jgi:hypothetical protein
MARKAAAVTKSLIPNEPIEQAIYLIRGHKVMLSHDLAVLYGVPTKVLMQAVQRNKRRFPADFMFQLTWAELRILKSQSVTSSYAADLTRRSRSQIVTLKRGENPKYRPFAFTEQGVAMLSSVLRSERAVQVNIEIMRAFVRLRRMLEGNAELSRRLDELEAKYDEQFRVVFDAIRELMAPPEDDDSGPPIGYITEDSSGQSLRESRSLRPGMRRLRATRPGRGGAHPRERHST